MRIETDLIIQNGVRILQKILSIFIVIFLIMLILAACASTIHSTDPTGLTEFFETYISTIWTSTEETDVAETESIVFDKNITFTCEYISNETHLPYALYIPSSASNGESIPFIVWLHGSGEIGVGKNAFLNSGLLKVLNEWKLDGFNAYVLCPHLSGPLNSGNWCSATDNIQSLLDMVVENYNVNTKQIILVGHSMGGYGAIHTACNLPEYFSKLVVLSGYQCKANLYDVTIPTVGYVGTSRAGEDVRSVKFMTTSFVLAFGEENTFILESSHGNLPKAVFNLDENDNEQSDILGWMFVDNIN